MDFCITIASPPLLDQQSLLLFRHWCAGITQNEAILRCREVWAEDDEKYGLEFPMLKYRMSRFKQEQGHFYAQQLVEHEKVMNSRTIQEKLSEESKGSEESAELPTEVPNNEKSEQEGNEHASSENEDSSTPLLPLLPPPPPPPAQVLADTDADADGSTTKNRSATRNKGDADKRSGSSHTDVIFYPSAQLSTGKRKTLRADDVNDMYQVFDLLEPHLCQPRLLSHQTLAEIPASKQPFLIETFWGLQDVIVRELVGGKRMQTSRTGMDELKNASSTPLKSIMRQYQNLKRVYSSVEERAEAGAAGGLNLFNHVQSMYLLSTSLAKRYACIVFLFHAQFNIPAAWKHVTCEKIEKCAALVLCCLVSQRAQFYKGAAAVMQQVATATRSVNDQVAVRAAVHRGGKDSEKSQSAASAATEGRGATSSSTCSAGDALEKPATTTITSAENRISGTTGTGVTSESLDGKKGKEQKVALVHPKVVLEGVNAAIPEALLTGEDAVCWKIISEVFYGVDSLDPDKDCIISLKDIRIFLTGEALDRAVVCVRTSISTRTHGTFILRKVDEKTTRSVCKALLTIGANLAQAREYRDYFKDVMGKVAEPLLEEGLSTTQVQVFLINCACLVNNLPKGVIVCVKC